MINNYNSFCSRTALPVLRGVDEKMGSDPSFCFTRKRTSVQWFASLLFLFLGFSNYAQTVLINPTGDGGFETGSTFAANNWTAVNSSTDSWITGSTPVVSAGLRCAYISSTPSTTQTWTYSQLSVIQHLYYDVTIPAGQPIVTLSFKWKVGGEGTTTSDWDNLKVFWGTTTAIGVPVANTALLAANQVSGTGAVSGMYKLSSASYGTSTISLSGIPGTTYRLVFSWKSDSADIVNPPAAIDEVSMTSAPIQNVTAVQGGLWSSPATWGGTVPGAGNDVTIPAGVIVTVDQTVNYRDLVVNGILQWNNTAPSATVNVMNLTGNLTINSGGRFLGYSTGLSNPRINIGGNLQNHGYANLALSVLSFNGSGSTLSGTGTFQGDGTNGIIASLSFANTGSNSISTSQNLIVNNGLALTAGSLNTNGKLRIDNTAQIYGQAFNTSVASVAVTNMGSLYSVAPVAFGAAVIQWTNITAANNTLYVSGNNVYRSTAAANIGPSAPTHTSGIAQNLLWIGTVGTIGSPFQFNTSVAIGTQVFYGNNLYVCTVAGIPSSAAPPVHTSGTANSGGATFLYVGSPATVSVNYDSVSQTVRSLNLTNAGSGLSTVSTVVFSVGVAAGAGSGAVATAVFPQSIVGPASALFQKSGGAATISGGLTINSDQGTSVATTNPQASSGVGAVSTTNGGTNYTVAPTVGFSGPTALNLVTNAGSGYTTAPTVTVTGGTLVTGTALATGNFTITVNSGQVVSVYLTGGTATYSVPPTLAITGGGGSGATLAFPAGSWPTATAVIGSNRQLTNFTVTNPGFGYVAAPTLGIGATSGTALGGTFGAIATTPTARVALYNLTTNFFLPATVAVAQGDDAAIPSNRKINQLAINGTLGLGMNITNDLTLFASATPLTIVASAGNGNVLDLGGKNLNFTWNGYAGTTSTFGATNTYIKNGSMSLTGRGGASTFNFPFSGTFTWVAGTTPTAVTTGSTVTRVTVSDTAAPTNTTVGTGLAFGNRAFRVQINGTTGLNPTVTMNYNSQDGLTGTQQNLFLAEATALSGAWTTRSITSGTGALPATGSRTTAIATPGPIVPTADSYYAWAGTAATITDFAPLTVCEVSGSFTITGTGLTGVTGVTIGGTAVTAFTVVSDTQITGFAGAGTTGFPAITKLGATITGTQTITVSPSPVAPSVSTAAIPAVNLGATVSVTASGGAGTFNWYNVAAGGSSLFTGASYSAPACATGTLYVAENNGSCEGVRTPVSVTVNPTLISASVPTICGTGGDTVLTATPSDSSITYTWSGLSGSPSFSSTTGESVTATVSAISDILVTATIGACTATATYSVSVYALPNATVTTTATGVCPGTSATINSGLTAGNFTSSTITHAPRTAPVNATVLATGGAAVVPTTGGDLDDGGWGAIPIGFGFNFFGTTYTTLNVGTNGVLQFGAFNNNGGSVAPRGLSDFAFTTLPSTVEPFNMIAVLANDNHLTNLTGQGGTVRYWTEGIAPNRRFIVEYFQVRQWSSLGTLNNSTSQAIFYETTGLVEVHVTASSSINNKVVGINNADGTIGALALTTTAAITTPVAYRFLPPANYNVTWSTVGSGNVLTTVQSGQNVFSLTVSPSETTIYDLRYTNQTTGCGNAVDSDRVTMTILSNTAPATTAVSDVTTVCLGGSANLSLTGNVNSINNTDGLTYQWQADTGAGFTNITSATSATLTVTPTVATTYQCLVAVCGGTAVASSPVSVGFTNLINSTTSATRCGTGSVSLAATTSSVGATINWYTGDTGGSPVFTGSPFTIANLPIGTATYYVAAETTGPACSSPRVAVTATATTPATALTLSAATATVCTGTSSSAVTLTSGSGFYDTYTWSPSTGVSGDALAGWTFNPTVSGTYTLTASQSAGDLCTATATVTVTVNSANVTTAVSTTPICLGASTTVSATSTTLSNGSSTLPGVYCVPGQTGSANIDTVTFNTLTGGLTQVTPFYDILPATGATTTTVTAGQTYPLTIATNGTSIVSVWFDWNRDGVFAASEWTQPWTSAASGTVNITVPSNAIAGATGMRIRSRLSGNTNGDVSACVTTFGSGTTQDYTINVVGVADATSSYTYSWSPGGATTASASVTPTTGGTTTYTVTATSPQGCVTTGTVDVLVNTDPVDTITDGAAAMCIGSGTIDFNNATNGVTWSSSNPSVATVDANGTVTAFTTGTTIINAFISNPSTGCTTFAANPQTVTVYAPISITSQPTAQSILTGDNAQFSVTATGSGLSYQWFSSTNAVTGFTAVANDATFSGAATATLSITAAGSELNGLYFRCEISGTSPCTSPVATDAVLLTVESISVTNPTSQTLCSTTTSTSFSVVASGNYQVLFWEVFDLNTWNVINNGDTYGGLTFSGEDTQTLVVNGITASNNLYQFRANVDDGNVTITSNPATLSVNTTASISSQPSDKSICYTGGTNTFRVTASDATGYQWQYATSASGPWSNVVNGTPAGATYANATTNVLGVATTSATPASGTYFYQVVVSSASPCSSVTSDAAQLTINTPSISAVASNSFICQPGSTGVTLTGSGAGAGGSYVWAPTTGLTGTGAEVTANPTATTTYTVTGTDTTGCSKTATVTVTVSPTLTATATATPSIICSGADTQLQANYTPVPAAAASSYSFAASSGTYTPISGGTASTASGDDGTEFPIAIGFPFTYNGTAYTELGLTTNGQVSLGAAIGGTGWVNTNFDNRTNRLAPMWDDNHISAGNITYQLSGAPGSQVFTIQWENVSIGGSGSTANSASNYQVQLFEGTNVVRFNYGDLVPNALSASIGITGASGNFLSVTPLAPASSSTVSSTTANNSIASVVEIPTGTSYTFTPPVLPTVSYSWSPATFLSATNIANPMATAVTADTTYTVTVTSSTGCSASTTVAVTLSSGIAITTQPVAAAFCQGTTATLSVVATGSGLTYQWRKDGIDIVGQTAATLSIPTAAVADSGSYDVVINDTCASPAVTSSAVVLTINPTPTATAPANQVACSGVATAAIALTGTPSGVTYNVTGGAAIGLANQTGVTSIPSFTPTTGTATISVTPVANGCSGTAVTFTYTVNSTPTAITITPSSSTIGCSDGPVLLSAAGGIVPPAGYCIPTVANVDVDFINNFSYAGIVNNGTGQTAGQYVDYTSLVANVVAGVSTPFSVQSGSGSSQFFGIFVDLNQNAIFETNEFLGSTTSGTTAVVNGTITIPTTALNGTTRLRVASRWNNALTSANACSNPGWGEYEDYSVNITGGTAPAPSLYVWSSQNGGLFTDAAGTVAYNGTTPRATIYAKPTATGTVTASRSVASCPTSGSTTVTVDICDSVVNLKLFIEGYMDGTTMRSVNNNQGGTMASTDVETVTVELHDATTLAVVHTTTGMLHTDGTLQAVYTAAPSGSFYISVKGANFIRTWTATAQTVGTTALTYDFSNAASKAAGNNMKEISGIFTFYSGDLDADGFIDLPDYGLWENDYTAGAVGAFASDLDGDGFVDLPDYGVWENNYTAGITEVQPTP